MPQYRKEKQRRPAVGKLDFQYLSKGYRHQIRVSYPAVFEEISNTPADWKTLWQKKGWKLKVAAATRETQDYALGQSIYILVNPKGKFIEVEPDILTKRDFVAIHSAMHKHYTSTSTS